MGSMITIFSGKGGVGQTSLALHLCIALTRESSDPALLLDLNTPDQSDISSFLELTRVPSLEDLTLSPGGQAGRLIQRKAAWYEEGIDVLCLSGPDSDLPIESQLRNWMVYLTDSYAWVIVDAKRFDENVLKNVLMASQTVLVPVTPDPLSLDQSKKDFRYLLDLGIPEGNIFPVLNRSQGEPDPTEVERCLHIQPVGIIPEDKEAFEKSILHRRSVFEGTSAATTKSFLDLAKEVKAKTSRLSQTSIGLSPRSSPSQKTLKSMKRHIKKRLLQEIDLKKVDIPSSSLRGHFNAEGELHSFLMDILNEEDPEGQLSPKGRLALRREILDECLGYGVIQPFVDDPSVTEIMVNGTRPIFLERQGVILETDRRFEEEGELLGVIERILAPLGRRVDEKSPMADGRLPDGSRVNAIIRPLAVDGPSLTIRKFSKNVMGPADLQREKSLSGPMLDFMSQAVQNRVSLLISGGTGSGKTTLLNALSSFIPPRERIITIEDAAELVLQQPHVVRLESRPPGIDGNNAVTIRHLLVNALRMRPTRIIVGECRSGEALDMLQAMNTGHAGSMTTLHANSPLDALRRLETLVLMAGDELPLQAIREHIASAIGMVIHLERFPDGSRKVVSVAELTGLRDESYMLKELFSFRKEPDSGETVRGTFEAFDSHSAIVQSRE